MSTFSRLSSAVSGVRTIPAGVLLFFFCLAIYSLFIYGSIRFGDEAERYYQARSLVDSQSFVIPFIPGEGITGVDNKPYSQFEMGYGLLLIPFYAFGKAISAFFPFGDPNWVPLLFVSLSNPVITSLTCVLLFWLSRTLGLTKRYALLTTLVYGLGTIALPYARALYREPTQACTLVGAVLASIKFRQTARMRWIWTAGAFFGYLAFSKVANLFMLPIFSLYLVLVSWKASEGWRLASIARQCIVFMIPVVLLLTLQGAVNVIKFGNFSNIGPYNYGNPIPYFSIRGLVQGVGGLLFSPAKSMFLFSPVLVLFVPSWVALFRKHREEAMLVLALVLGNVLFSGSYIYWDGGSYWGPRYLVLITPLMMLSIGVVLQQTAGRWQKIWAVLIGMALIAGLGVQGLGALINEREYLDLTGRTIDLAGAWDLARHGSLESLAFFLSPIGGMRVGMFGWAMIALAVVLSVGLFLHAGSREAKSERGLMGLVAGVCVAAIMIGGFVLGVVAPFPNVLTSKGDTKYVAANSFFVENRFCDAQSLYSLALSLQTTFERESMLRLDEITPSAQGPDVELGDLMAHIMSESPVHVDRDYGTTVSEEGAVRIHAPHGSPISIETDSDFVEIRSDTTYELSGWYRSEGVSESGYGVIGWYEDNAKWQQGRSMELATIGGTQGWTHFRKAFKTLPTTRRALLKAGLWQTSGTIWVDGIRLVQVEIKAPPSRCTR